LFLLGEGLKPRSLKFDLGGKIEVGRRRPDPGIKMLRECRRRGQLSLIFLGLGRALRPFIRAGLRVADGLG
jgi:hypothetical protein